MDAFYAKSTFIFPTEIPFMFPWLGDYVNLTVDIDGKMSVASG